jgi:O-methyltransferase
MDRMTADKALWDALKARAMNEVYWPKAAPTVLSKDMPDFYSHIADFIGRSEPIDYLEFGVARGISIGRISERFVGAGARFVGFDSFEGLPEKWLMHDVGAFSNNGRPPVIDDDRVTFVTGYFQNTVPSFLDAYRPDASRPVLVYFDADLYSATLFLLSMLWAKLDEYFFVFDNFIYDEVIALRDFCAAFPVEVTFLAQTQGGGARPNPDQVFGRMKRVPFVLRRSEEDGNQR